MRATHMAVAHLIFAAFATLVMSLRQSRLEQGAGTCCTQHLRSHDDGDDGDDDDVFFFRWNLDSESFHRTSHKTA